MSAMAGTTTVTVELPYPPSVNRLWRSVGGRTLLSREGRRYRREVMARLAAMRAQPMRGRLAVRIELHPPDRRRCDIDNAQKALVDALEHAGLFEDDSQIDDLHTRRAGIVPGGRVLVEIVELA
jgi:crossover junction endodeoxyribonuclease RusA